jgi:uncharacterized protein (DUF305 family)
VTLSRHAAPLGRALALSIALSLASAACGGDDTTATSPAGGGTPSTGGTAAPGTSGTAGASESVRGVHNAADVEFAQLMIVHHRGALEMAEMAVERAQSEEVVSLAEQVLAAQGPEIDAMTGWLKAWGEPVPEGTSTERMHHGGMDHGGMPGMMTEEQMSQLMAAEGAAFDRMFLEMMTEHHRGAIEMALTEQAEGESPQAVALAEQVESSQMREIEEMQQLLQSL